MFLNGYSALVLTLWLLLETQGCLDVTPKTSLDLVEGSSVLLTCQASCSGSIIWYMNGNMVPNVSSQWQLSLDKTRTGVYECDARLINGSFLGRKWVANITVQPINAPEDQYAIIGSSTNLICSVNSKEAFIRWYSYEDPTINGSSSVFIHNVSLRDDHSYICQVALPTYAVSKIVHLHVIAPPMILSTIPPKVEVISNHPNNIKNVTVEFSSRPADATRIIWYKNGVQLSNAVNITTTRGALYGNSLLIIPSLAKREDSGIYTIVIENSFNGTPTLVKSSNISFELSVKVLPAMPINITIYQYAAVATIAWKLQTEFPEENPSNFTVHINGHVASQISMPGNVLQTNFSTIPGVNYTVNIVAYNIDGYVNAAPVYFTTLPGAPQICSGTIRRLNFTAFHFLINFSYDGGAAISALNVSYRLFGSFLEWSPSFVVNLTASNSSSAEAVADITPQQQGVVMHQLQFKVLAVNALSFRSESKVLIETVDPPGAAYIAQITSSHGKLSKAVVQLSEMGSPPIIQVVLVASKANLVLNMSGPYLPGAQVVFDLTNLPDNNYIFSVYATNYAGDGPYSAKETDTAVSAPQSSTLPLWSIVIVALLGAFVCSTVLALVAWIWKTILQVKNLNASQESVASCVRVFPPLAAPLVPRSPTIKTRYYHPKSSTNMNSSKNDEVMPCNVYIHHYATVSMESIEHLNDDKDFAYPTSIASATDV